MNIAIITPLPPGSAGGVESFTSLLVQILKEAGHEVKVFDRSVLDKKYKGIFSLNLLGSYKLAYDLGRAFHRQKYAYDVVICNGMFGWCVRFPRAINIIHGSIAGHAVSKRQQMNFLSYLKMRYPDSWFHSVSFRNKRLVAVSKLVGSKCEKYNGITMYTVIPNAVDIDVFKPRNDKMKFRRQFDLPTDAFLGVFVGRAVYGKGIDVIEALGTSLQEPHNIVVAAPDMKLNTQSILPLTNVPHDQMPYLYNACDYFILPSRSEGSSLALLEALASGLPAIATNVGFAPELAEADELLGEFILETFEPKAFVEKIQLLYSNEQLRAELGQRAREHVVKNNSMQVFKKNYLKLINDIVASDVPNVASV